MICKVLTVDDSKTLRLIVSKHLSPFGVQVLEAENGMTGLQKAQDEQPDLILLDYNMPVMDGYQTLEHLKHNPATRQIPVIMLTTETVQETVVKLVRLGLKDYIAKPFSREMLLQKVNPILRLYSGDTPAPPPSDTLKAAPAKAGTTSDPSKLTILAVDDKPILLKILKQYLGDRYNIITAENGSEAIKTITRTHFDYLFLALSLPDMSGLDVFRAYQQAKKHLASGRKVVVMAPRSAQRDIKEALEIGFRAILYKPFTQEDVEQVASTLSAGLSGPSESLPFVETRGNVGVLTCPDSGDPTFLDFLAATPARIPRKLYELAEAGCSRLTICASKGMLRDQSYAKRFALLVVKAQELNMSVNIVAADEEREKLEEQAETRSTPLFPNLEEALKAFEQPA